MPDDFPDNVLLQALKRLGETVQYVGEIQLLIVGGAAGMLSGLLPAERTTGDIDVADYNPPDAESRVLIAAEKVAKELRLPPGWFSSDVQIRLDTLPEDWKTRRTLIDRFGPLTVYAVGRLDLLTMKLIAHRPQDMVDVYHLAPEPSELLWIRRYLDRAAERGTRADQLAETRMLLDELEGKP
jgi:hypothetical protein